MLTRRTYCRLHLSSATRLANTSPPINTRHPGLRITIRTSRPALVIPRDMVANLVLNLDGDRSARKDVAAVAGDALVLNQMALRVQSGSAMFRRVHDDITHRLHILQDVVQGELRLARFTSQHQCINVLKSLLIRDLRFECEKLLLVHVDAVRLVSRRIKT